MEGVKRPNTEQKPTEYLSGLVERLSSFGEDIKLESYPEDSWELVTIHFKDGSVTLTKEAKKIPRDGLKKLISDLKSYRDEVKNGKKREIEGIGGAGSLYLVNNDFIIKESTDMDAENTALQNSYELQSVVDSKINFQNDVRLVHAVAILEPSFLRKGGYSRKRYKAPAFKDKTVYGGHNDKRESNVEAYVVMPFIANSVSLEELLPSKQKPGSKAETILNKLIEDGILESKDEETIKRFIWKQQLRIIESFREAQYDIPSHERGELLDCSERNILIRLENADNTNDFKIVYYKIDH